MLQKMKVAISYSGRSIQIPPAHISSQFKRLVTDLTLVNERRRQHFNFFFQDPQENIHSLQLEGDSPAYKISNQTGVNKRVRVSTIRTESKIIRLLIQFLSDLGITCLQR